MLSTDAQHWYVPFVHEVSGMNGNNCDKKSICKYVILETMNEMLSGFPRRRLEGHGRKESMSSKDAERAGELDSYERTVLREQLRDLGLPLRANEPVPGPQKDMELRADRQPPQHEDGAAEKTTMSRRGFLKGVAAAGAVALAPKEIDKGIPHGPAPESAPEPPERPEGPEEIGRTESAYFEAYADAFIEQHRQNLSEIVEYGSKITNGDPQERTRFAYLSEAFEGDRLPPTLRAEIQKAFPAIAVVESGLVGDKVSSKGAKGILQIMPSTFKWLGKEGENELSLIVQARIAGELLERTYLHWQNEYAETLDSIKEKFFNGDTVAFERDFLGPALTESYNAGMGLMGDVFTWFDESCKSTENAQQLLGTEKIPSGKDIFVAMVRGARKAGVHRDITEDGKVVGKIVFGDEAEKYPFKVVAAEKALTEHTPQEDLALLWRGESDSS